MGSSAARNQPCACKSGEKTKFCCDRLARNRELRMAGAVYSQTLRQKNIALLNAAFDIFDMRRGWEAVRRKISDVQIRELYLFLAKLWPANTDVLDFLPEPSSALRALYLGEYAPEVIVQNVCRFGLYADEIYLINPFQNPNFLREEFNPIIHPESWHFDTLRALYQVMVMAPWVDKGFVCFIPNPADYDRSLLIQTVRAAKRRMATLPPMSTSEIDERVFAQNARDSLMAAPEEYFQRTLREMSPELDDQGIQDVLDYIRHQRENNPFQSGKTLDKMGGQMQTFSSGTNLDTGMYICQMIGAFPYTNFNYRWKEILSTRQSFSSDMETWTPLTKAFQNLQFSFLDRVQPEFAYAMREEERLGGFRAYLRKLWTTVGGNPDPEKQNGLAREFSDELGQSYEQAKKEWSEIDIDLIKWVGGGAVVSAAASAFTHGGLGVEIPAAGFAIPAITQLLVSGRKRKNFRSTNPMSVFIDLERKG